MSDQPSEAPLAFFVVICVVAITALTASAFVGITTELNAMSVQHAKAPAAVQPHG